MRRPGFQPSLAVRWAQSVFGPPSGPPRVASTGRIAVRGPSVLPGSRFLLLGPVFLLSHVLPSGKVLLLPASGQGVRPSSSAPSTVPVPPLPGRATFPPVPAVKTPTDRFRELLAAGPEQREALLSRKTPAARALIEAKLREFGALRPDEREIRLRLAQFQDALSTLLPLPPQERRAQLAMVPAEDLPMIEERLAAWDQLPEAERRDLLESERRLSWFVRQGEVHPDRQRVEAYMASLPPAAQRAAREQLERWLALPPSERSRKSAAFSRFFDLTPAERQAALRTLSETERRQMERALADFSALSPDERSRCVSAFRRFEAMEPAEREQFLRKAERWRSMSPNDRAAWRRLVDRSLNPQRRPPLPTEDSMLASPGSPPIPPPR